METSIAYYCISRVSYLRLHAKKLRKRRGDCCILYLFILPEGMFSVVCILLSFFFWVLSFWECNNFNLPYYRPTLPGLVYVAYYYYTYAMHACKKNVSFSCLVLFFGCGCNVNIIIQRVSLPGKVGKLYNKKKVTIIKQPWNECNAMETA